MTEASVKRHKCFTILMQERTIVSPVIEMLEPTAENFRAEIARHQITQYVLADIIGMNVTLLSHYVRESREMPDDAAERIAAGLNRLIDTELFRTKISR